MSNLDSSLQLVPEVNPIVLSPVQKVALSIFSVGVLLFLTVAFGGASPLGWVGLALMVIGPLIYFFHMAKTSLPGVKNHHIMFSSASSRGVIGWFLAVFITGFYVLIYFWPSTLKNLIILVDPVKVALTGSSDVNADGTVASQWFFYGFLYTLCILVMGVRAIIKYRHSPYQMIRSGSVMFFQLGFAFLIPNIMLKLNKPYYEWTNIWPLRYYELFPSSVNDLMQNGALGKFMVFWGVISILIITPLLTYFFGKRWYCSWVCGCGGLAETLGDPYRQNSDKSLKAWKVERWLIHSVLVFIVLTTGLLWLNHIYGGAFLGTWSGKLAKGYGFLIGAVFSGVIGVGFYPIMGSRVWCRFGCPMAAVLGIFQRFFSRFRITTNGGQCISCGNCSTYCEMGIDVRSYAQRGANIVRASCVGCGVCSTVCPRGVLNLENGPTKGRLPFIV